MKRLFMLFLALTLVLGLIPCVSAVTSAQRYVLPVFETSDIHGHLVDTSSNNENTYQYRMAYIADKVDDARQGDVSKTLLLDGGDIYQGQVVSNLQNGWPMVAAFDAMEYDAVALGNHEFDWGIKTTTDTDGTMPAYTINGVNYDSKIPVLCCNIFYSGTYTSVDFTQDYVILDKIAVAENGDTLPVRVAVVGYVCNYASSIMSTQIAPYTIRSGVYRAEEIARKLLSAGEADCAVLLTHADAEETAASLSGSTPFVLVCGGHSHQNETGTRNGVVYMEPRAKASSYATANLCFDGSGTVYAENPQVVSVTDAGSKLYDTVPNKTELAADVMEISHFALEGVTEALTHPLGYITTSVTNYAIGSNSMSSTGGNWMTDLANRATGAKVSFTNNGGIRSSFYVNYGKRTITKGDIFTIAPFGNHLYVYDLSYAELLTVLNYAVGSGSGLGLRMSGIDCYYQNRSVQALVEDGKCIYKNGTWTEGQQNKIIRVSANEFIATSSGTPFYKWNSTSRFVGSELVDNESFIQVLEQEGHGDGLLYVDPNPHLIQSTYSGDLAVPDPEPGPDPDPENPFVDVDEEVDWFAAAVLWATSQRPAITSGTDETHFSPNKTCTRAEVVQFLWNAAGQPDASSSKSVILSEARNLTDSSSQAPQNDMRGSANPFVDVKESDWFYRAVMWAVANGITSGTDEAHFSPAKTCTRAEVVQFLWNAAGQPDASSSKSVILSEAKNLTDSLSQAPQNDMRGSANPFMDVKESDWFYRALMWAVANGITSGTDETHFSPVKTCTRAEVVQFLFKASAK